MEEKFLDLFLNENHSFSRGVVNMHGIKLLHRIYSGSNNCNRCEEKFFFGLLENIITATAHKMMNGCLLE